MSPKVLVPIFTIITTALAIFDHSEVLDSITNLSVEKFETNETLIVSFTAFKKPFKLTLSKVSISDTPETLIEDDDGISSNQNEDIWNEIYIDEESQTSLMLSEENEDLYLEGIIFDQFRIFHVENQHFLTILASNNEVNDLANDYERIEDVPENIENDDRRKRSVSLKNKVRPEILTIVDKSLFAKLGNDVGAANNYVRNFWNAVNLRFKQIDEPKIDLNIAGIIIGKTSGTTPYLQKSRLTGRTFEAKKALDLMGKHFYTTKTEFPIFDLVVTLTNLDMCSHRSGKCNSNTVGYAYVGGACVVNKRRSKINSVAIVEDSGGYSGVVVAAHEVAHLLGVVHDGDQAVANVGGPGAGGCKWSDGYIMSDNRRTARGVTWSTCSRAQLRHFLSSSTATCLHNTPHNFRYSLLADHTPTLDEQCQQEAGPGSKSCFNDQRVCTQLFCISPSGGCISYHPAVEGSSCGSGSTCSNGHCVKSKSLASTLPRKPKASSISNRSDQVKTKIIETNVKKVSRNKASGISSSCHDRSKINVRGVTSCNTLLKTFSFTYCGNNYIKTICCASHALFCSES